MCKCLFLDSIFVFRFRWSNNVFITEFLSFKFFIKIIKINYEKGKQEI